MFQSSVKTDKKARKESPVQKPEFDKAEKAKDGKWHGFTKLLHDFKLVFFSIFVLFIYFTPYHQVLLPWRQTKDRKRPHRSQKRLMG